MCKMSIYQKLEALKSGNLLPESLFWEIASDAEIFGISFSEMKQRMVSELEKATEAPL